MIAFVGLGSNLGDRLETLQRAIMEMKGLRNTTVTRQSSFYETEPVGDLPQPFYLNAVIQIKSDLSAKELMSEFLRIEKKHGRIRTVLNAPRTLDMDLLFYGHQIIDEKDLIVPHPRLHLRKFTLIPLAEIAPQWTHPVLKKSVRELLEGLGSSEEIMKMEDHSLGVR